MGYNTDTTEWPSPPVKPAVKALLDRFLNLLDDTNSTVGDTLADEIFTHDARAQFGPHRFDGEQRTPALSASVLGKYLR